VAEIEIEIAWWKLTTWLGEIPVILAIQIFIGSAAPLSIFTGR
jgi:hypothetical protein